MTAKVKELLGFLEMSSGSGDEYRYAGYLADKLKKTGLFGDVSVDRLGNVTAVSGNTETSYTVMLEAHFDEVSMLVKTVDDNGFITPFSVGGSDRRTLLSSEVTVNGLDGVVCSVPPHLMQPGDSQKVPSFDKLFIDVGLPAEEVRARVKPGDRIDIKNTSCALLNGRIAGKALDNKASVYIVLTALKKLKKKLGDAVVHPSICVLFASQEEVGSRGARTGAYSLMPDEAIILDVTFAAQKGAEGPALGSGAVIEYSGCYDRHISRALTETAKKKKIPFTVFVSSSSTGTDGDYIPLTGTGIPAAGISLPIRNMHTSVEVADIADIEAAADLLCEYIRGKL